MACNKNILFGRIAKIHGHEGAVAVKLEKAFSENIPEMESIFLEIEGRPVPFFICWSEYAGADILILKFDGYDTIEKISEFKNCRVFLTTDTDVNILVGDIETIKGFKVYSKDLKLVGTITDIIQNTGQWLLNVVTSTEKKILIPLHEHFIIKMDSGKKTIRMDLPEGLLEIN